MDGRIDDNEEPMHTELDLPNRYDLSQLWAEPITPKLLERHLRRVGWLMVSKAARRSRKRSRVARPLSAAWKTEFKRWTRDVSVEWWCLHADCNGLKFGELVMWGTCDVKYISTMVKSEINKILILTRQTTMGQASELYCKYNLVRCSFYSIQHDKSGNNNTEYHKAIQ